MLHFQKHIISVIVNHFEYNTNLIPHINKNEEEIKGYCY